MAKKALFNLVVGDKHFEKGKIYTDKEVTKDIDESNFEDVSDSELKKAEKEEVADSTEVKIDKKGKKVPGESLEG